MAKNDAPTEAPTATDPIESPIAALTAWLHAHIHNSVVSRETAIYNRVHALVEEIKAELHKL